MLSMDKDPSRFGGCNTSRACFGAVGVESSLMFTSSSESVLFPSVITTP